ncbi:mechanosensitive ion channel family protein [Aurantivibrio plasticivorans]
MDRFWRSASLFVLLTLFGTMSAIAQDSANSAQSDTANEADSIDVSNIEELITTLESETARTQFIANLKTLVEQVPGDTAEPVIPIMNWFNISPKNDTLVGRALSQLKKLGLSDSSVGNLLALIIALLVIGVVVAGNHALAKIVKKRLKCSWGKLHFSKSRFSSLFRLQIVAGYVFGFLVLVYATAKLFQGQGGLFLSVEQAVSLLNFSIGISVVLLLLLGIWEVFNALMEVWASRNHRLAESRIQTLTPIIRNVLLFVLSILGTLIVLSELGIDIVPLMAGAGVVGIAIGFGAQTLVKDFLTGFIVIFEDLMQVGDVVNVGDRFGLVEKITIRKIQLRDLDGTVHTVPFGEVTTVSNLTKEFSYYLFDVGIAYRENVDDVMQCLQEIDEEMRNDDEFKNLMLEPLEVLGVDKFADSAVVIKARVKTRAHDRWKVGREFNRRMKHVFDDRNIEIPFPHQTLYFGEDKDGSAPDAKVRIINGGSSKQSEQKKAKRSDTD